mgnify:CR=1 FL=1
MFGERIGNRCNHKHKSLIIMAEIGGKKISELDEKTTLEGTEYLAVADGSTNKKVKASLFKGLKGETGAAGAKGDKGDTGATGAKGDKGDTGATGAAGRGVKSIALTKDANGAITGGTVTFTDSTTAAITITTATA